MKILITGANGYIGQRIIPSLLQQGHQLICTVRSVARFMNEYPQNQLQLVETDFNEASKISLPPDIDIAYFLIHAMRDGPAFEETEKQIASSFLRAIEQTNCRQVIYLSGIVNEVHLSKHLSSRLAVEKILRSGKIPVTVLRAGIIVGSGSSSFEIIRDLVEKLPVMITPKWVNTKCQPIGIRNVIEFLTKITGHEAYYNQHFDIGGPDILTYKQMLLQFGEVRHLKRHILTVPVMTPRLSSFWLYFVTSTSYNLAVNLVDSMKINVVCKPNHLAEELGIELLSYKKSVELAFQKIEQNEVISSWKDSFSAFNTNPTILANAEVPEYGCFKDDKIREIKIKEQEVQENLWSIGGERGWYYGNALWKARGFIDKAFGGVGLRRGRTSQKDIQSGDALDFWRVLAADKINKRLLLYAEMKLPGEAWLEFQIVHKEGKAFLTQTATFRPKGLWGRLYWYSVLPFHYFIFNGMINNLIKSSGRGRE